MTRGHRTNRRDPLVFAWIFAGSSCIIAFSNPQVVAAQTGSADVCEAAQRFAEADEVRLPYVAMTRTTERLFMTYHRESGFAKR